MTCDPSVFSLMKLIRESADKTYSVLAAQMIFLGSPNHLNILTSMTIFPEWHQTSVMLSLNFPFPNANYCLSKQWAYRWQKKDNRFHWDLLLWRIFHLSWISKMELPFSLCELQSQPWEGDLKQGHLEDWQPKGSGIILVMASRSLGVSYWKEERP